jgi:hypothetical protein
MSRISPGVSRISPGVRCIRGRFSRIRAARDGLVGG